MECGEGFMTPTERLRLQGEALEREYAIEEDRQKLEEGAPLSVTHKRAGVVVYSKVQRSGKYGAPAGEIKIELSPLERFDLCQTVLNEGARFHDDTFTTCDVAPIPVGRSPAYINPSTKFRMLEGIASAEGHLKLIDSYDFAELPEDLSDRLVVHRKVVVDYVDRRKHHLAPIRALPVEILLQIFTFARSAINGRCSSLANDKSQSLSFARVCCHWRDVCLHNGSLWSSVDINVPDLIRGMTFGNERLDRLHVSGRPLAAGALHTSADDEQHAKTGIEDRRGWATIYRTQLLLGIHLCYSGSSPLTIRLSGELPSQGQKAELSDTMKRLSDLMVRLAEHSTRWRDVCIEGALLDCLPEARGPFPILEALRLGRMSWRNHSFTDPFLNAPKLRSFAGATLFPPGIGIPWAQLHEIRLEGGVNPLLETLAHCTNLSVCTIAKVNKRFSGYPLPERMSSLDLRTLRFVQQRSTDEGNPDALGMMFQVLRLPLLEALEIHSGEIPLKRFRWCAEALADMVAESCCSITRLTLSGITLTLDEFFGLSQIMPMLDSLVLSDSGPGGDDRRMINDPFFVRMSSTSEFPRLRHLSLDGRMRLLNDDVIPQMVDARFKEARRRPDELCSLATFKLVIRRRHALTRRALVRLHEILREGFLERWVPPTSMYKQTMTRHSPVTDIRTRGRRVRLIEALEGDLSETETEEDIIEVPNDNNTMVESFFTV